MSGSDDTWARQSVPVEPGTVVTAVSTILTDLNPGVTELLRDSGEEDASRSTRLQGADRYTLMEIFTFEGEFCYLIGDLAEGSQPK